MIFNFDPTILELDMNYVLLDHDKNALCDSYIVDFIHDTTESYSERVKYGCGNFYVTITPLFMLKFLKLHLFSFPMLVSLCFIHLFSYKIPMHMKWVRLKCVLYLLLDPFVCLSSYFYTSIF